MAPPSERSDEAGQAPHRPEDPCQRARSRTSKRSPTIVSAMGWMRARSEALQASKQR